MSAAENKELTKRFIQQIWNEKDVSSVADLVTENFTLHVGGGTIVGRDKMGPIGDQWFKPFPDLSCEILDQVAEGDRVTDYVVFKGHHTGIPFHPGLFQHLGLPPISATGKQFEFTQISITRFEEGKMAEVWEDFDRIRLWLQLGVKLHVPES